MPEKLREWARALTREVRALYAAARDPRTPWYARALALAIVAYAVSPIDLIPDVIPVVGLLDDLLLLPLGILLVRRMIPGEVMASCRKAVDERAMDDLDDAPGGRLVAALVILAWIACAIALAYVMAYVAGPWIAGVV